MLKLAAELPNWAAAFPKLSISMGFGYFVENYPFLKSADGACFLILPRDTSRLMEIEGKLSLLTFIY